MLQQVISGFSLLLLTQQPLLTLAAPSVASWNKLPAIGQGVRQEHSTVATNDKIWVLGGTTQQGQNGNVLTTDRVESYSVSSGTWSVAPSMLTPLNHVNAAAVKGKIYVLGGLSAGDDWVGKDANMVYDPSTKTWTPLGPSPKGTVRGACAVGVYGDTIYLAGGQTYIHLTTGAQDALTTVTAYNTATKTWNTNLPPLPKPRQHVGGAVVGDTFYVLGGRTTGQTLVQNSVFALDLRDPQSGWKVMAAMPTARGGLACAAVKTNIFCMGGEGNPNSPQWIFNQVEAYDTQKNVWTKLAPMPVPKHGWGIATIGDTIYSPGGGLRGGTMPTNLFDAYTVA